MTPSWRPIFPSRDGKRVMTRDTLKSAVLTESVLALGESLAGGFHCVRFFGGPDGVAFGEISGLSAGMKYVLSPDGRRVAYLRTRGVAVSDTAGGLPVAKASTDTVHTNLRIDLNGVAFELTIVLGDRVHVLSVDNGCLAHKVTRYDRADLRSRALVPPVLDYDRTRFPVKEMKADGEFVAAVDRLGQIVVTTPAGDPIVLVYIRREKIAVALPDGTVWGDPALIGGPPTPDASRKIAEAIRRAGGGTA
jgi:hypothetical protein